MFLEAVRPIQYLLRYGHVMEGLINSGMLLRAKSKVLERQNMPAGTNAWMSMVDKQPVVRPSQCTIVMEAVIKSGGSTNTAEFTVYKAASAWTLGMLVQPMELDCKFGIVISAAISSGEYGKPIVDYYQERSL